jgi:hypothetical protein
MKHPGHTYGGFVSAISERGMAAYQESGEDLRAGGPPGLLGALLVAQIWKLCQNPLGSDRVSRL